MNRRTLGKFLVATATSLVGIMVAPRLRGGPTPPVMAPDTTPPTAGRLILEHFVSRVRQKTWSSAAYRYVQEEAKVPGIIVRLDPAIPPDLISHAELTYSLDDEGSWHRVPVNINAPGDGVPVYLGVVGEFTKKPDSRASRFTGLPFGRQVHVALALRIGEQPATYRSAGSTRVPPLESSLEANPLS